MATTTPKPFVFVLMPFDKEFDDTYKLGIRPACEEAGAYCERLDEQIFEERMLDRIYNQISKADMLVADMSDRNPNVFYEVGYAHALGKRVILLTKRGDDIPFDLKQHVHIVYDNISSLKDQLRARVGYFIANPSPGSDQTMDNLELFLLGERLPSASGRVFELQFSEGSPDTYFVNVEITFHNSCDQKAERVYAKPVLILPKAYTLSVLMAQASVQVIALPDGKTLHNTNAMFDLEPGAWDTIVFRLLVAKRDASQFSKPHELVLRLLGWGPARDIPIHVIVHEPGQPARS
jgi:hypothetical protein